MKSILTTILFAAGLFGLAYIYGPLTLKDLRTGGWTPATELHATKAVCRTHLHLDAFCEFKYAGPSETGELNYLTIGPWGADAITFVRASDGHVSLQQGVDRIWRRAFSFVVSFALAIVMMLASLRNAIGGGPGPATAPAAPPAPVPNEPPVVAVRSARPSFGRR